MAESLGLLRLARRINLEWPTFEMSIGEPSRLGIARIALQFRSKDLRKIDTDVLVDHSLQKAEGTREMFGFHVPAINPYDYIRGFRWRALLLASVVLPERLRRVVVAATIARSLESRSTHLRRTLFWNPGNLVQFALALSLPRPHVYVLAPEYPPISVAERVYASRVVHEIQRTHRDKKEEIARQHSFISYDVKFVFYFTQLAAVGHPEHEEILLINVLDQVLARALIPVEVRPHYHDLRNGLPDWFSDRYQDSIVTDESYSLNFLSWNQVSFSGASSIGYELVSLGVMHGIMRPTPGGHRSRRMSSHLAGWLDEAACGYNGDDRLEDIMRRLATAYPDRLSMDEASLLFDGKPILK